MDAPAQTGNGNLPAKATRVDPASLVDRRELSVSNALGGIAFTNMAEVMSFGSLMANSGVAVPAFLRSNPGACIAVCIQAIEWRMSPYAVANKSYVVNDRISYESQLIHAVIEQRAPLVGRLRNRYTGEGNDRRCIVWAHVKGEKDPLEFQSATFGQIQPKNSPLWKTKPDLQLYYNAARDWARMYFPDVILGVYSTDELEDAPPIRNAAALTERLNKQLGDGAVIPASQLESQARPPQAAPQPVAESAEQSGTSDENPPGSQAAGGDGGLVPEVAADIANGRKGISPTVAALSELDQTQGAPSGEESQAKPGKSEATDIQLREAIGGDWSEATKVLFDATEGAIAADLFAKALGKWAMGLQKKGKESSISFETRKKLYLAIKAGKFDFNTGKIID
jgi:hypothetical protein